MVEKSCFWCNFVDNLIYLWVENVVESKDGDGYKREGKKWLLFLFDVF